MVTIDVTEHRFLAETGKVVAGIDKALDRIEAAFAPLFAVIFSLAEGADRMVVQRALGRSRDIRLIVPLPLPQAEYERAFASQDSKEAFRCLLARAGNRRAGELVALARERGMPMAWVHAGNRKPATEEPTTLGEERGTVTSERFPEPVRH
jgi:hypothetical protein